MFSIYDIRLLDSYKIITKCMHGCEQNNCCSASKCRPNQCFPHIDYFVAVRHRLNTGRHTLSFVFFTLLRTRSVLDQLHFLSLRVCHSRVSHTNANTAPPLRAHHVCLACHENEIILFGLIGAEKTAGESLRKVGISLHNKSAIKNIRFQYNVVRVLMLESRPDP